MSEPQEPSPQPPPPPTTPPAGTAAPAGRSGWSGGRVVGMIFASIASLIGLGLLLGGLALVAVHAFARDDDGYYSSNKEELRSPAYAVTTDSIDLGADVAEDVPADLLGTVRVRAQSTGGKPIFLGIGPSTEVERYLAGVGRSELVDFNHGDPVFSLVPGRRAPRPPDSQDFWVSESEGAGDREISWDVEAGTWTVAVLNADGSRGVTAEADIGAKVGWLLWVGIGLALAGGILIGTGIALIVHISRRAARDPAAAPA
jgi:hypothetical protein